LISEVGGIGSQWITFRDRSGDGALDELLKTGYRFREALGPQRMVALAIIAGGVAAASDALSVRQQPQPTTNSLPFRAKNQ
jgi:hypothetical protein